MNSKKMALLTVMVIVIGLFALPNTVLFIEEEWKETPMTSEEVLLAWEKLPPEWKEILSRWEELPPEFGELLSEWETVPEEWKELLPAWKKLTHESKELILKYEELPPPPVTSGLLCLFFVAIPAKAEELPAEWEHLSDDCKEFLREWEKLPPDCKELLLKWDELPQECKKLLENWAELPAEWKYSLLESEGLLLTPTSEVSYEGTEADEAEGIMAEIQVSGAHRNFSCDTCHNSPITETVGSSGYGSNPIECMDCHGDTGNITDHWVTQECENCSICHWISSNHSDLIIVAGGFGMTTRSFDVGGMAAHEDLILLAENNTLLAGNKSMAGANEACVACHTDINVRFTMPKKEYMRFEAGMGNVTMKNKK